MSWIQTYTGQKFSLNVEDFDKNVINPLDIAHALSNICRFGGHSKSFYSVAQHSVLVSYACPDFPLAGLLHDACEAYLGDVVTQLKRKLSDYGPIERSLQHTIAGRFNLPEDIFEHPQIKEADMMLLATEKRDVLVHNNLFWSTNLPEPAKEKINPVSSAEARRSFMWRLYELLGIRDRWDAEDKEDKSKELVDAKLAEVAQNNAKQS